MKILSIPVTILFVGVMLLTFNIKQEVQNNEWKAYIFECLEQINKKSQKGFSFNKYICLK